MTNRGQFSQLLAAGLMAMEFDHLDEHPEEYSDFCELETSDGAYEEWQNIAGLGPVRQKLEGEPISYDDPIQGGSKRIINATYGLGWICSKEMLADDKYGVIRRVPGELIGSYRHMQETVAAAVLNGAFSAVTTADGVSLINTAHPMLDPTVTSQSNRHASNADLSQTAIQDLIIQAETMTNERGLKRYIRLTDLMIPPQLKWVAQRLLQSQYEPGSGNNDINPIEGIVTPNVLHYLTSTTAWFMRSRDVNFVTFQTRQKPQTEAADDFDTKGQKHSIDGRFAAGAFHWFGWLGSSGAGA